jgi:hypothetical protein
MDALALYRRALLILESFPSKDYELVKVLSNYAAVLRQLGRSREARKLEARARAISATQQSNWARYTVDVSNLLPSH